MFAAPLLCHLLCSHAPRVALHVFGAPAEADTYSSMASPPRNATLPCLGVSAPRSQDAAVAGMEQQPSDRQEAEKESLAAKTKIELLRLIQQEGRKLRLPRGDAKVRSTGSILARLLGRERAAARCCVRTVQRSAIGGGHTRPLGCSLMKLAPAAPTHAGAVDCLQWECGALPQGILEPLFADDKDEVATRVLSAASC